MPRTFTPVSIAHYDGTPRRGHQFGESSDHREGQTEQGFVGTFNERVFDTAEPDLKSAAAELLIVGNRGRIVAAERGLVFGFRRLRQEEITGEIIEFSAGSISAAASVKRKPSSSSAVNR